MFRSSQTLRTKCFSVFIGVFLFVLTAFMGGAGASSAVSIPTNDLHEFTPGGTDSPLAATAPWDDRSAPTIRQDPRTLPPAGTFETGFTNITFSTDAHPELRSPMVINTSGVIQEHRVCELNDDGLDDFVVVTQEKIIHGVDGDTGEILFTNADLSVLTGELTVFEVGHFSNNSHHDVVAVVSSFVPTELNATLLFIGGSTGVVQHSHGFNGPLTDLRVADFDEDALDDVVFTQIWKPDDEYRARVRWHDGLTGVEIRRTVEVWWITDTHPKIAMGLVTGDDKPDVYLAANETIFLINGADGATLWNCSETVATPSTMITGDMTGDGYADLVYTTGSTISFVNGTTGELIRSNTDCATTITSLATADLNNDSFIDFVAAAGSVVYFIDGNTSLVLNTNTIASADITSVAVGDLFGSAHPDVLISAGSSVHYMNGSSGVSHPVQVGFGSQVTCATPANITSDSRIEVAVLVGGNLTFAYPDLSPPSLLFAVVPEIACSVAVVTFELFFDEPNIDTIELQYVGVLGNIYHVAPAQMTSDWVKFEFLPTHMNVYRYWFVATDIYGNSRSAGSETDPLVLRVFMQETFSATPSPDPVSILVTGDFNNDSVPDVATAVANSLVFIDGTNGSTMYTFSDSVDPIELMDVKDYDNNGVPDVLILAGGSVYWINGLTGLSMRLLFPPYPGSQSTAIFGCLINDDNYTDVLILSEAKLIALNGHVGSVLWEQQLQETGTDMLAVSDVNGDGTDDIVASAGSVLSFVSGSNGTLLFENNATNSSIALIARGHFNADTITDIVYTVNDTVVVVDGSDGSTLSTNVDAECPIVALKVGEFNADNITDIVIGTSDGRILILDGTDGSSIYSTVAFEGYVGYDPEAMLLAVADLENDGVDEIVITAYGWTSIDVINSFTGGYKDSMPVSSAITTDVAFGDFDGNGVLDILVGLDTGVIMGVQSMNAFLSLLPQISYFGHEVVQGTVIELTLTIQNIFDQSVMGAEVHLTVHQVGTGFFMTIPGTDLENGSHCFEIQTGDWQIGEWCIFPLITREPYNTLNLNDYLIINGEYSTPYEFIVVSECFPVFELSSNDATFLAEAGIIKQVIEGNEFLVVIRPRDMYYHPLAPSAVSIAIVFEGIAYIPEFVEPGYASVTIPTKDLKHGEHELLITFEGEHLTTSVHTLVVDIIPQFPELDFTMYFLAYVAVVSFVLFFALFTSGKSVYKSLDKSTVAVQKKLSNMLGFVLVSLVLTLGAGAGIFFVNPLWGFLTLFAAFGIFLMLYYFWFFKLLHYHLSEIDFSFRKSWIGMLFFVTAMALLVNLVLFAAGRIEWFDYFIGKEQQDVMGRRLPRLYWDIGIVGFASGFLFVVLTAFAETYSDIKRLRKVREEVEKGYYPKQRRKLRDEVAKESRSTFRTLALKFAIWYGWIAFTFVETFEIYDYMPLFAAVVLPALAMSLLVIFRGAIYQLILVLPKALKQMLPLLLIVVASTAILFGLLLFI